MEGPTPVCALIHAATMVAAGVYLVARSCRVFEHAPGRDGRRRGRSALSRRSSPASIALAQTDIKRVLAYSTVSQLGYMFAGARRRRVHAPAIFHLFTHAFFKALLFLGSGSVIHAMDGEQDMRRWAACAQRCRSPTATFLIGALALCRASRRWPAS